jgi:DnaK suppressor protein
MRTKSNQEVRLKELRASLLAERARITSERQTQLQVLTTPENTAAEDQVPLLHEQFVAISTNSRNRQKLALIQSALDRLERGEFAICEECEEEIPFKRLQAIPWALYCVPCQEQMEIPAPRSAFISSQENDRRAPYSEQAR